MTKKITLFEYDRKKEIIKKNIKLSKKEYGKFLIDFRPEKSPFLMVQTENWNEMK